MYITEEVAAIDQAHETQRSTVGFGFWKPFKALGARPNLMWRLFLGCMLFFWQNGSGINAINYYSPTIFKVRLSHSWFLLGAHILIIFVEHWR